MAENVERDNKPNPVVRTITRLLLVLAIGGALTILIFVIKPAINILLLSILVVFIALGLLGVFPLTYFAYLGFGADAQRKRLRDDFQLFGLVDDKDLDDTINTLYQNVYSWPQFVTYILLIMVVTAIITTTFIFRGAFGVILAGIIEATLFAYLGAYVFSIQELIRRYNTFDLQPQVYSSILVRMLAAIVIVFVIATATGLDSNLVQIDGDNVSGNPQAWMIIVAFAIGIFPSDGMRWILNQARRILNPPTERSNELSLRNILGISTFHESRLAMMGIDNAQNLATVDIPKLLLTTQFDTQQVANWIDQAILYVKVGDNIDRFREAKINTFHEFQRTMDSLVEESFSAPDSSGASSDGSSRLSSLATILGLANTFELSRLREYSNFPNYTHLDSFYEGSGRLGSLRAEESVQKLTGIGVIDRDWSSVVDTAEEKENLEKEASSLLRKLNGRTKDPSLYTKLGIVYYQQRKCQIALEQFDKAIRLNNKFDDAYFGRSVVNLDLNKLDMAINDISRVIDLNPANAQAFNHRGEIYLNSRFYDRAIEDLNKALELDSSLAVAYNNRGVVYNAQGMFEEAIAQFECAKLLGYRQAGLWLIWGLALIRLEKYSEAIEKLSVAITKNPKLGDAFGNRGKAYIELGEEYFDQAKKDLDKAIKIAQEKGEEGKGWALDNDLGMLEFKKGKFKNSIDHFEKAVEKHKNLTGEEYFWGRVNLAMAYYNLGELENAIKQFQVLRKITQDRALDSTEQERYNYFAGLIKLSDEEYEKLNKVLETNRQFDDPKGIALALVHVAEFNRKRGDLDEALKDLNEAQEIYTKLGIEKEITEIQQQIDRINANNN